MATTRGNNVGGVQRPSVSKKNKATVSAIVNGSNVSTAVAVNAGGSPTTSNAATSNTFTVSESVSMAMRAKTITFSAQGLKPNTVYYPFFNNVFVGAYCTTVSSPTLVAGKVATADQTLTTDSLGALIGNFFLPANTFTSGSHTFKLVDNIITSGGNNSPDPLYGSAEAQYEANGILKQQQTQVTVDVVIDTPTTTPVIVNPVNPTVNPTPVKQCERWFFEYKVGGTKTEEFTVTTNTSTPPTSPSPRTGGAVVVGSVTYISTSSSGNTFNHKYRYTTIADSKTFRQEFVGPTVTDVATDLPSLTSFRPTGIPATSSVVITKQWTKVGSAACPVTYGLKTPTRVDPLAQSFFVDAATYPNGLFVTSIGVYFKTIDQSTPVVLELREMANGLPSSDILPGGVSIVPGYRASSSANASMSTVFRFDYPIFLRPSTDYCFVIKSSSLGYNAWCSRIGEIDKTSGKVIDTQPFTGSLFKSENDVTWTPDQYEDIKFDLYKADFNTGVTGQVYFRPQLSPVVTDNADKRFYYSTSQTLPLSFISTTKGSKVIGLNIPMHSLTELDEIYIDGIVTPTPADGYNNIRAEQLNGKHAVNVIDEDNVTITVTGDFSASKTGNLLVADIYGLIDNVPAVMPADLPFINAVPYADPTNLSPSTIQTATLNLVQPTPPVIVSSNTFTVYSNIQVNEVMIDYMGTEVERTAIVEHLKLPTTSYVPPATESGYFDIDRNGDFYSFDEPRMVTSVTNERIHTEELNDSPGTEVFVELVSNHKDVSPVLDLNGMTLTVRSYKIDNQGGELTGLETEADYNDPTINSEIEPGTGNAAAKYKGPTNILLEAYNSMSVFVTANCPSPAAFDVYVRSSTDVSTHMDRNWVWVPVNGVFGTAFVPSPDKSTTNEWLYVYNATEPFTVFDVKIVMRSTNSSIVPKIYGVRAITDNI